MREKYKPLMKISMIIKCIISVCMIFCTEVSFGSTLDPVRIYERNKNSIGLIHTDAGQGSGVVIAPNIVLTNCHVIAGQRAIIFKLGKVEYEAIVFAGNRTLDLCKLVVPSLLAKSVVTRDVSDLKVGERVYAIGNPRGFELTLSEGLVSGIRDVENTVQLQITAPISPGSSGGGLFDSDGRLIGITTSTLIGGQNINFAMPAILEKRLERTSFIEQFDESSVLTPAVLDYIIGLWEKDDVNAMIEASKMWSQRDGESTFTAFMLGMAWGAVDNLAESKVAFENALRIDPSYAPAINEMAAIERKLGNSQKADELYRKCASIPQSNNSLVGGYVALCRASIGDFSGLGIIEAYINNNPSRSWLHFIRADVLMRRKEYEKALESANEAIRLNPQSAISHVLAGAACMALHQSERSKSHMDMAMQINPNGPSILEIEIIAAVRTNNKLEAKQLLQRLELMYPRRAIEVRKKLGI